MRVWRILPIALFVLIVGYWWLRPRRQSGSEAYVGEHSAAVWSSLAEVKQQLATLRYGEKVAILERRGEQAEIRTAQGLRGWVEARQLMDAALWQRSGQGLAQARSMPVQARGRTKVSTNVHIEPGRAAPRIYQFPHGASVEVLSRAAAEWLPSAEEGQPTAKEVSEREQKARREDWFFVRGFASSSTGTGGIESAMVKAEDSIPIAGWVLARFVELNLPGPVRDYASSSGLRVVAWFELNRVSDEGEEKPQYLAAGVHGGEGQPCDFTMLRVYTWGARRKRYETAYVESGLCGYFPIKVGKAATTGEPEFRFTALGKLGKQQRVYRMRQTVVRRLRDAEHASVRHRH